MNLEDFEGSFTGIKTSSRSFRISGGIVFERTGTLPPGSKKSRYWSSLKVALNGPAI